MAAAALLGGILLSGCSAPAGTLIGAAPSPTPSAPTETASPSPTASPTPSASPTPTATPTPSPTPTAAPSPATPPVADDDDEEACRALVEPAALARLDATGSWMFHPASERAGAETVLPFDSYGGLECLWGPAAGDIGYHFGYVSLPSDVGDARLHLMVDAEWTETQTAEGTQYCNPGLADEGRTECYLVNGSNWYFTNADGVFPTLAANAPI